ncbi:hypothetical protein BJX70DRAFT_284909 [Aspergillus crustosus]
MRPPVPEVAPPRSRKSSLEQQQWVDPRTAAPSTFFLARSQRSDATEPSPVDTESQREIIYGVQSLEDTISASSSVAASLLELDFATFSKPVSITSPMQKGTNDAEDADDNAIQDIRQSSLRELDYAQIRRLDPSYPVSNLTSPRPQTPLNHDDPSSLPSSPKSITNHSTGHLDEISLTDDLSSQAVASGEEDEGSQPAFNQGPDSISQLIMPSITMPTRRPFTDKGRALGRVKLLLAGTAGSGKTSLIKSIVQICEDIVHVDFFDEPPSSLSVSHCGRSSRTPHRSTHAHAHPHISEIYASSKPYPSWWSDLEDSRVLRRRKSTGEIVLERNICFVDTLGTCSSGQTDSIIQYMSQQLLRATSALDGSNADFQNLLAGNGGSQVDVILFLLSQETLPSDVECISRLSAWTNVIPLIAKSDLLMPDQITSLKCAFNKKATTTSFKPLHMFEDASADSHEPPFAVSSAKSNDDSIMDASTLMSPDYVQPLVSSDLAGLVQNLFDRENAAWLRHSAAKKLAQRQREMMSRRPISLQENALSLSTSPYGLAPSYAMARVSDYSRHEEKRAQIQLAKWASDLQQSLHNERERYAALSKGERAGWLAERLGECVVDGTLVPIIQTSGLCGLRAPSDKSNRGVLVRTQNGQNVKYHIANISPLDPLGVVGWSEDFKQRGWAIVQIVSSFGVVGGLALWLAKTWGLSSRSFSDWRFDWYFTSD